jgi:hypothetical protein
MITSTPVYSTSVTSGYKVYYSTANGGVLSSPGNPGQTSAVTSIILCNTGTPDLTDETVNAVTVNIYLPLNGVLANVSNIIVSNLTIPAGETVFFSDERLILNSGDSVAIGCTSGGTETAGTFTLGASYTIVSTGTTTNWTAIGAASSAPGTNFIATGAGSGDGTATRNLLTATVSSLPV